MSAIDANQNCVAGTPEAGKADSCAGCPNQAACASGAGKAALDPAARMVGDKLELVKHKILVLSGKGGVGKSTVASQMALTLASQGHSVGLLDVDICGPSVPRMMGLTSSEVHQSGSGWTPIHVSTLPDDCDGELLVMSVGFMLPNADDAVIWRGPRKNGLIKQFLTDVDWGNLDYLIVDTPPGTSDEHLSIIQYLRGAGIDGAVVVSTPQEVCMADVRKELNFCKKTKVDVIGVVENMAGYRANVSDSTVKFVDPQSGQDVTEKTKATLAKKAPEVLRLLMQADVYPQSGEGPSGMAATFGVPYLGKVPMDANLTSATENGLPFASTYPDSPAALPFLDVVATIEANVKSSKAAADAAAALSASAAPFS